MKKTDSLEKFIIDNRNHFEELTPSPNSWDKICDQFNQDLKAEQTRRNWWISRKIAAAIIVILALYGAYNVAINITQTGPIVQTNTTNNSVLLEYSEAEAFYINRVESKVSELEQLAKDHPKVMSEIKEEFKLLDQDMKNLKNDLKDGIANQEIVEAMMQNYRIKLKIIENIHQQLNASNSKKSTEDEKTTTHI